MEDLAVYSILLSVEQREASLLGGLRISDGEEPSVVRPKWSFAQPIGPVGLTKKKAPSCDEASLRMAPGEGLEPPTRWLTAICSTN